MTPQALAQEAMKAIEQGSQLVLITTEKELKKAKWLGDYEFLSELEGGKISIGCDPFHILAVLHDAGVIEVRREGA